VTLTYHPAPPPSTPLGNLSVAHWTDLHVGERAREGALTTLVDHALAQLAPHSTAIVISGDLTHNGGASEIKACARQLLRLRVAGFQVLVVPGNHDCGPLGLLWRAERRAAFNHLWRASSARPLAPRWPQVARFGGWRFILLDSCEGQEGELVTLARGELGLGQLARLELELAEPGPVVVVLHHHPFSRDLTMDMDDSAQLLELLGRREVGLVLFGHMHRRGEWTDKPGVGIAADGGQTTEPVNGAYQYRLYRLGEDGRALGTTIRVPVP